MEAGQPSRTALGAAILRAQHQVLEGGCIFTDPLALSIIGADAASLGTSGDATTAGLRRFIAARSRFAEDALAAARKSGTRQLVLLGAGLDTFAYRADTHDLRIFEVDHPATQAWKRTMLATLGFIAGLPGRTEVVFDYTNRPETVDDPARRAALATVNQRAAALGEVVLSEFETEPLHGDLAALGFRTIEDLGPGEIAARFYGTPGSGSDRGAHMLRAATD